MPAEGFADPILAPTAPLPGLHQSPCSPQRPGLPGLALSRAVRLADGRPGGAPVHTGAPGAGPATSPGKAPTGGGRLVDKKPPGRPERPVSAARLRAGPAPTSGSSGELQLDAIPPPCLSLSVLLSLAGGQASEGSKGLRGMGNPMDTSA